MNREWLINVRDVIELALQGYIIEARPLDVAPNAWLPVQGKGAFYNNYEYRAVPPTIKVNGFDVPQPIQGPLMDGQSYFIADPSTDNYYFEFRWSNSTPDLQFLKRKLIHVNSASAIAHAKAMIGLPHDEDFA